MKKVSLLAAGLLVLGFGLIPSGVMAAKAQYEDGLRANPQPSVM